MSKIAKWITAVIVLLIVGAVAAFAVLVVPYVLADTSMPEDGVFTIHTATDGSLELQWPEANGADRYHLELRMPYTREEMKSSGGANGEYKLLWFYEGAGTSCTLPDGLPTDRNVTIWINTEKDYWNPLDEGAYRSGSRAMSCTTLLSIPQAADFAISSDPEARSASLNWSATEEDLCRVYVAGQDGQWQELGVYEDEMLLTFGEDGTLPMPEYGEKLYFAVTAARFEEGLEFYGLSSEALSLEREDLLGRELNVELTEEGENVYSLTWNETKGEYYEVQMLYPASGQWRSLGRVEREAERSFSTGHLEPFTDYTLRVVAKGGQTLPDSEEAAIGGEISFSTVESPIFATVWPLKELEIYSGTDRAEVVGTAPAARAYCVLDEADGLFRIRHAGGYGYIDSSYCLINLAEYIGNLCNYDITNSYSAIYMVHEFAIPEVTDTVVEGYEKVRMYDESFIVPLLYPVAQKLIDAALDAQEQGYRLKIYDSYRPNKATKSIYNLTLSIINEPIPEEPFTDVEIEELNLPEVAEGQPLTYYKLVTNGTWNLGNFLATTGSYHNMGIALDLTLEDLRTGEELQMQTSMHDLSWYSVIYENNETADVLDRIMKGAGFGGLTSEWWHFQDNDTRDSMGLRIFMWEGVGPECWMLDDSGWRYRKADGSYYTETIVKIDGVKYIFDEFGYAEEYYG